MDVKNIYCIKCKKHTTNENLVPCVTRKKKPQKNPDDEISYSSRNAIKANCGECKSKKHILVKTYPVIEEVIDEV
jgi:hypothetical protein